MKPMLIAAVSLLVLTACQAPTNSEEDQTAMAEETAESAAEAGTDASAEASGGGMSGSGPAATGQAAPPDAIGAPPPINGQSGAVPGGTSGTVRPEMGGRLPEDPTTENLARPETPMPQTTPDGRPGL